MGGGYSGDFRGKFGKGFGTFRQKYRETQRLLGIFQNDLFFAFINKAVPNAPDVFNIFPVVGCQLFPEGLNLALYRFVYIVCISVIPDLAVELLSAQDLACMACKAE